MLTISTRISVSAGDEVLLSIPFSDGAEMNNFISAEYFFLKAQPVVKESQSNGLIGSVFSSIENPHMMNIKYVKKDSAINNLRMTPIYHLPKEILMSHLKSMVNVYNYNPSGNVQFYKNNYATEIKENETIYSVWKGNTIADIQYNYAEIFNEEFLKNLSNAAAPLDFLSKETILSSFEEEKGTEKLIGVIEKFIESWKNADVAKRWNQYIQEVKNFSSFPGFINRYFNDKSATDLLFNILVGLPDKENNKKWQEIEVKATRNLYKLIA